MQRKNLGQNLTGSGYITVNSVEEDAQVVETPSPMFFDADTLEGLAVISVIITLEMLCLAALFAMITWMSS